jgi:hypothetical protein
LCRNSHLTRSHSVQSSARTNQTTPLLFCTGF